MNLSPRASGRLPAAILMSGTGSNARRLLEQPDPRYEVRLLFTDNPASNAARIAAAFGVECVERDIRRFCGAARPEEPTAPGGADGGLRDPQRRAAFDRLIADELRRRGVRLAALAGYDWVIGAELCRSFLFVNVHPGDLRVRDAAGRRVYVGLGWVPTAKAILNGERFVRSSTHLVTAELDGGPIARVSAPVPVHLPEGTTAGDLLPPGVSLGEIVRDVRRGGQRFGREPIVLLSRRIQEQLKVHGDWVEFPATVQALAALLLEGRLVQAPDGSALLDGRPVCDLFLQPEGVP